ncbi:MAG: trypsin-like peptidase domain-containing protein [Bacteroidales bacterium]|nr:trypsin-like peptidase domain-containing protein [Bacteroidales bacterium]
MKAMRLLILMLVLQNAIAAFSQQYWKVNGYTESDAKSYLNNNSNLNQIEGVWQSTDGFKYAIEKDVENGYRQSDKYRVIVLESGYNVWKQGEIKGFITPGTNDDIYSYKYYLKSTYDGSHTGTKNLFLILESPTLAKYSFVDNDYYGTTTNVTMYKLYPKPISNSSNNGSATHTSGSKWSGTGFFLTKSGYIITNQHVIDGAKTIKVTSVNGNHNAKYNARVEVSDKQNDLALIKITDSFSAITSIPYTFKFSASSIGENCWVLGYPLTNTMGEDIKLTNGIISSKSGFDGNIAQYQISAPVQPGNSGGPLFDNNGNLIGVVQAKHGLAENAGYAIKASYVRNLVEMLPVSISYPQTNLLSGKSLPQQVELASKCVCMIICE